MGGELVIDTDHVSWFKGYGPLPIVGPCSHDCQHRSMKDIAWGPDMEHYTLDECHDCLCRAWIPVIRDPENQTKPLALYDQARWMEVEREPLRRQEVRRMKVSKRLKKTRKALNHVESLTHRLEQVREDNEDVIGACLQDANRIKRMLIWEVERWEGVIQDG